jgi:hypothetical protein
VNAISIWSPFHEHVHPARLAGMAEPEQRSQDSAASGNPSLLSRRNLPRASHACQRCRAKKAKCDQRKPCANCIRHSHNCVYGIRRRNGQNNDSHVRSPDHRETVNRQDHFRSPASTRGSQDELLRSENPEQIHGSARSGTYKPILHDFLPMRMLLIFGQSLCTPVSTRRQHGCGRRHQPAHSRD